LLISPLSSVSSVLTPSRNLSPLALISAGVSPGISALLGAFSTLSLKAETLAFRSSTSRLACGVELCKGLLVNA